MKLCLLILTFGLTFSVFAQTTETAATAETTVLNSEVINVDGYVTEKKVSDNELETVQAEIQRQKKEIVLNREKAKQFKTLSKSVEKLSETTEEYMEEKRAAKEQIAEYNTKVKCLQSETPGPECDKFIRRKN